MPLDNAGKYHMNPQRMMGANAMKANKHEQSPVAPPAQDSTTVGEKMTSLHDHGDGTFHTEDESGQSMEHPDLDTALDHMKAKHGGMEHGEGEGGTEELG